MTTTELNFKIFCFLILVMAIGSRPKSQFCLLLRWTLLPKEHYGGSVNGCGSNTQPSNWEADTLPLSYLKV